MMFSIPMLLCFLLDKSFEDFPMFDTNEEELTRSKKGLGNKTISIDCIICDISDFKR